MRWRGQRCRPCPPHPPLPWQTGSKRVERQGSHGRRVLTSKEEEDGQPWARPGAGWRGQGSPAQARRCGLARELVDGAGLCSPWPLSRLRLPESATFARAPECLLAVLGAREQALVDGRQISGAGAFPVGSEVAGGAPYRPLAVARVAGAVIWEAWRRAAKQVLSATGDFCPSSAGAHVAGLSGSGGGF